MYDFSFKRATHFCLYHSVYCEMESFVGKRECITFSGCQSQISSTFRPAITHNGPIGVMFLLLIEREHKPVINKSVSLYDIDIRIAFAYPYPLVSIFIS